MFLSPCRTKREAKEFFSFLSQVPEWGLEWAMFFAMGGDAFEWLVMRLADKFRGKGFDRLQAESMLRDERANRILQKLRGLQQYFSKAREAKKERKRIEDVVRDIVSGKINPYKESKKKLIEMGFSYSSDGYKEVFSMSSGSSATYCWNNRYGEGVCLELDRYLYGGLLSSHSYDIEITVMRGDWYDSYYRRKIKFAMSIDVRSKNCYNNVDVKETFEGDAKYEQRRNRGSRSTSQFWLRFATNDEDLASSGAGIGSLLFNAVSSVPSSDYVSDERIIQESREDLYSGLVDLPWIITCSDDAGTSVFRYSEYKTGKLKLYRFLSLRPSKKKYSDVYNNKKQCNFIRLRDEERAKRKDLSDLFVSFSFGSYGGGNRFFWFGFDEYERDVWGTYKRVRSYSGGSNAENQQGHSVSLFVGTDSSGKYKVSTAFEALSGNFLVQKAANYTVNFADDGFRLSVPGEGKKKAKARRKRKVIC